MEPVLALKATEELDVAKYLLRYTASHFSEAEAAQQHDASHEFAELRERVRLATEEQRVTVEQLQQYYQQLECVAKHFPVSEGDAKLSFVWHDSLSPRKKCAQLNLFLERAATIFNMAVCHATQAAMHRQQMSEGASGAAAQDYMLAAACFRQLRTNFADKIAEPITQDLSPPVWCALEKLMEAEAQELFLSKAEAMPASPPLLAKIAQGTASLWQEAQRFIGVADLASSLP